LIALIARLLRPPMCNAKLMCVASYRAPDSIVVAGVTVSTWQCCGKRPGHDGEHGSWGRWFMWRTQLANWLAGE
jgi:hypothetical protein